MTRKNSAFPQIFTVRNGLGEFLGTYIALTPDQAIAACKQGIASCRSTSKGHGWRELGYQARVEPSPFIGRRA